jgi:polyketide-type polyunsaturated fatty acid synthase PfaA
VKLTARPEPIAIVGMACLLPKAPDLATYWRNILDGRDCTTEVPDDHSWKVSEQYDADPSVPDKTYCHRGGFIDKVPFDPMEFGITPNALDAIDTSQLLSLIVAREALKDAGIDPDADNWPKARTSCVIGVTGTQEMAITQGARLYGPTWKKALLRNGVDDATADTIVADIGKHFPEWQEQTFPGLLGNVVAGRIANRLDLGGTNCVVDAACASSLAAIQLAMGDLQTGRADLVLSGGVDTLNDIFMYMCFSKTPAFSKTQDGRPFDAKADGILIAEGIAMVTLKRLADAERDGDRVYAVIRGIGSSSDGRHKSIYAPNSSGQTVALRRAYEEAGFPLETIELVEAHGTGTKAGDTAEVEGLKAVFAPSTRPGRHVAVGSVKSNIGHTKSTAGAAGLVKAALALYERVLPPTAKVDLPNPKMGFEASKLYVNPIARPWIRAKDHPRRAGVSAFGFGGSNFHLALEEHGDPDRVAARSPANAQLFLLSGATKAELAAAIDAIPAGAATVAHAARQVLESWAPNAQVLGFVATSTDDLHAKVATARALVAAGPGTQDGVTYGVPTGESRKVAVLFPGQGSQYVEMGRTLMIRHATVRAALDRAEDAFQRAGKPGLAAHVFPPPAFDDATRGAQQSALTATEWAQPAIGAVSKGLWDVLAKFGVSASAFAGHSYGELVALCAAGALDEDGLWTASRVRGEAMADKGVDRGTMAAVSGELAGIQAVLDGLGDGIVLANKNHPKQGVISGSKAGIDRALAALAAAGIAGKQIAVSAAFHSPLVADASAPFAAALADLPVSAPKVPVYANKTAAPYPADPAGVRELLVAQITSPVDFVGIIDRMYADGARTFVECGPKGVLAGLLKHCFKGKADTAIVSLDRDEAKVDGDQQLKSALVALAARGVAIDVAPLLAETLPPNARKAGSKATVWLGGPNYRRPETKHPAAPAKVVPLVPATASSSAIEAAKADAARARAEAQAATAAERQARAEFASAQRTPPQPVATAPAATVPVNSSRGAVPMSHPSTAAVDGNALAALLDSTRQTLAAFQQTQERTAGVHAEFLRAHQKANDSFATLFASHARLVEMAAGAPASALPAVSAPAPVPVPVPVPGFEAPRAAAPVS